jgi:hypothetical protein
MTFDTARDLSSQVVAIPMTSFGMLMNSPDSEFQRITPQKRQSRKERLSFDNKSPKHSANSGEGLPANPILVLLVSNGQSGSSAHGSHPPIVSFSGSKWGWRLHFALTHSLSFSLYVN